MARKRTPEPPPRAEPELRESRDAAAQKLDDRIAKGRELLQREVRSLEDINKLDDDYDKWNDYNRDLLLRLFTTEKFALEYRAAGVASVVMGGPVSHAQKLAGIQRYITGKIGAFESIKERLELIPEPAGAAPSRVARTVRPHTNRAFIVHGHDEGVRETVARLLDRLGIEPIILHEQATGGRTIVEKLEHYSDVDFAVILLTPDDVGASKRQPDKLEPRARQNVILELGYFVGKLGRDKVCALYQQGVDMPSDYLGVGYVQLDAAGGWRLLLARELREAGFDINMNDAL